LVLKYLTSVEEGEVEVAFLEDLPFVVSRE
jgi:hypothetical protein